MAPLKPGHGVAGILLLGTALCHADFTAVPCLSQVTFQIQSPFSVTKIQSKHPNSSSTPLGLHQLAFSDWFLAPFRLPLSPLTEH